MKKSFVIIIIFCLFLSACIPESNTNSITVFAAASLTEAFTEMAAAFEHDHPNSRVLLNFAGSNSLRSQIELGAMADVFASANLKEMDTLVDGGLVEDGTQSIFLKNKLVVLLPENNPASIHTLEDLARPGLKLVLASEEVPAGRYARQTLANLDEMIGEGYSRAVLSNVVSNEDTVKKVVAKVQLGEADAGIVYSSDSTATPELQIIDIPDEFNTIGQYPIAILSQAPNPETAKTFVEFVLSDTGQEILKKWGFISIMDSATTE